MKISISIHALLAESDSRSRFGRTSTSAFLSTLSLRRATNVACGDRHKLRISIHALLAESDALRSPRIALMVGFLSTLSLRRATFFLVFGVSLVCIFLSTLSLRRATILKVYGYGDNKFLSTLSLRRATGLCRCWVLSDIISIHALLAESDVRQIAIHTIHN